jgi:triacylglycerol lipase
MLTGNFCEIRTSSTRRVFHRVQGEVAMGLRGASLRAAILAAAVLYCLAPGRARADFCWPWEYDSHAGAEYTRTEYPIVLTHGAFGFDNISVLGVNILDYWYELDSALRDCDGASVHVLQVSPSHSTEYRGEQLLAQIQNVLARTGKSKVNIIAHSMGGLDARYVMNVRPDLVASVTAIGSPHKGGSTFATIAGGLDTNGKPMLWLSDKLGDALQLLWGLLTGYRGEVNPVQLLNAQMPRNAEAWNQRYPAGIPRGECDQGATSWNGIRLYSWTGSSANPWTSTLNPLLVSDVGFNTLFGLIEALDPDLTDGLVGVCSSHFGSVLRDDYNWNHTDEVNLLWGITADFEVNPKTELRKHANRLRNAGL